MVNNIQFPYSGDDSTAVADAVEDMPWAPAVLSDKGLFLLLLYDKAISCMDEALSLAHQAVGRVSPNPAVGAVLVKDGRVVGRGVTQPSGGAHAEVMALGNTPGRPNPGKSMALDIKSQSSNVK